ncbi:peptidase S54 [Brevundimonas sp. Leaf363]|uniref:rhomboid family intramembrane serine protease n=1 Tax=Brevundimonas sp. Leaf363 TaxID=1736353 RepID=UPI0007022DB7|nr:rhomboid family intramembrane serine protease [Brevundimonas sp. Leaf363]KQS54351.1 peptidase S54 [Brevundimonas sp. Leaf363]
MPWSAAIPEPDRQEPWTRAPLLAVLLAASMPALFFLQLRLPDQGIQWAFYPVDLEAGRPGGLFTAMLLHGGWVHAVMNAVAALAFGTPLVRALSGRWGAAMFLALYIVCGVLSTLGYGLLHLASNQPMVGASGAVFGLIGATTRLTPGGRVARLTDRHVLVTSVGWMGVNLITGLLGLGAGVEGARIAWEAHAFGFIAGLLLVGPLMRLHALSQRRFDSGAGWGDPPA